VFIRKLPLTPLYASINGYGNLRKVAVTAKTCMALIGNACCQQCAGLRSPPQTAKINGLHEM
jgi:hypothetical protein